MHLAFEREEPSGFYGVRPSGQLPVYSRANVYHVTVKTSRRATDQRGKRLITHVVPSWTFLAD